MGRTRLFPTRHLNRKVGYGVESITSDRIVDQLATAPGHDEIADRSSNEEVSLILIVIPIRNELHHTFKMTWVFLVDQL